jgi:hypothetical protein
VQAIILLKLCPLAKDRQINEFPSQLEVPMKVLDDNA